jgi:glyoxylase-like metal-dependent hydrolase (beta-lactamase superfamily II)
MLVDSFPVGPLQCNCSIVACKETGEAAIIDPGGDFKKIVDACNANNLKIKYLLHTHAHFDHIAGSKELKQATGAQILLHKGDQWLYDNLTKQGSMFGFRFDEPLPVDRWLEDDEIIEIGKVKTSVIHTPGHTPGSLCFAAADKESILFSGDTLFHRSIGRTDLWGGSYEQIINSIENRLLTLDDSTRVICGHGPDTDIWSEKKQNPFLS